MYGENVMQGVRESETHGAEGPRTGAATKLMLGLADRFETGRIRWVLPDGTVRTTGKDVGSDGARESVSVHLHNDRVARKLFTGGNIGIAEAYMDGDYDADDLAGFLTICATNISVLEATLQGQWWFRNASRIVHWFNRNTETGSRRNIHYHYDLGNSFYERWLDPSMTYSSAEFLSEKEDLLVAQENKYERLAQRLEVAGDHHVLEIGCGWGGFAEHVAKSRGARVTALTISDEQYDFAARRIQREGLGEKVNIVKRDYRHEDGNYDRIASIEMFEAVGENYWPVFFGKVKDRLSDAGRAALQIITIDDDHFDSYKRRPDFIQRYIFPGGMLPSPSKLRDQVRQAGLVVDSYETFGLSYARTLAEWNRRFQAAWPEIAASTEGSRAFDMRFKRMWEYYLAYCEAGFRAGVIDVCRVAMSKA
ncbi:class I SAM-dependent methyltransferase [Hwanghaeella sp.]|uniref:class I SAM-dependent methyltransferase n=1 Tax=Hwanghaeella sp. TaxID=2605943 RepID=UPI003CCC37AF